MTLVLTVILIALKINVVKSIVLGWVLTLPASALIAYLVMRALRVFGWH